MLREKLCSLNTGSLWKIQRQSITSNVIMMSRHATCSAGERRRRLLYYMATPICQRALVYISLAQLGNLSLKQAWAV